MGRPLKATNLWFAQMSSLKEKLWVSWFHTGCRSSFYSDSFACTWNLDLVLVLDVSKDPQGSTSTEYTEHLDPCSAWFFALHALFLLGQFGQVTRWSWSYPIWSPQRHQEAQHLQPMAAVCINRGSERPYGYWSRQGDVYATSTSFGSSFRANGLPQCLLGPVVDDSTPIWNASANHSIRSMTKKLHAYLVSSCAFWSYTGHISFSQFFGLERCFMTFRWQSYHI